MAVRLVVRHAKSAGEKAGGVSFELDQARVALGRGTGADVRLPDLSVSEHHATVLNEGSRYLLRDEGSTNGTSVNGTKLVAGRARTLESGDEITIGAFHITCTFGAVALPNTPERTASLARRLLRELTSDLRAEEPPYIKVVRGKDAGTLINLGEPPARLVIGRGEECELTLDDVDVSRTHVELVRDLDGTLARDLESKNGLIVNHKRMRERRLRSGDLLTVGGTDIVYEDPADAELKQLEGKPDALLTHTMEVERAPAEAPADSIAEPAPSAPQATPSAGAQGRADLIVYALALTVLVASVIGLVWLFS